MCSAQKRPVEDCTRINVMTALSEEIFPSKGNPNGKNYIKVGV